MELKIMRAINHENVVRYLNHCHLDNGDLVIFMELAEDSLFFWVIKHGPVMDRHVFLDIGFQLASGMAAIHQAGFIHRDIKPRNVLIKGRFLKICDFGLSVEISKNPSKEVSYFFVLIKLDFN